MSVSQLILYKLTKFYNMKTLKLSIENIQGKLSRKEMKNIMAGNEITCWRSNGLVTDSFSSDNSALMGSWAGFWTSASWAVRCSNGFRNNIYIA